MTDSRASVTLVFYNSWAFLSLLVIFLILTNTPSVSLMMCWWYANDMLDGCHAYIPVCWHYCEVLYLPVNVLALCCV